MASVRVEANHGAGSQCPLPYWKLYHNPHYSPHAITHHLSYSSRSTPRPKNLDSPSMIVVPPKDDDSGGEETELDQGGYGAMSSELELCVARIRDLRSELEFERRMRRKAEALSEALAAELAEERRRCEAAEAECRVLREEAAAARDAMEEVEEERRMLRVAELWREERVQMKLADARAAMEEKLREIDDAVAAAASDNHKTSSCCCCSSSSPNGKATTTSQHGQQSPSRSQHGQESPSSRSQQGQPQRREAGGGGENPHIRRGIKGFVEFPKAVRVRPREERVDLVSNLECQRAQLRVLMRNRSPAAGMGLVAGVSGNLVV